MESARCGVSITLERSNRGQVRLGGFQFGHVDAGVDLVSTNATGTGIYRVKAKLPETPRLPDRYNPQCDFQGLGFPNPWKFLSGNRFYVGFYGG